MKNCTLKPFRGCGKVPFGTGQGDPTVALCLQGLFLDYLGVARMNTDAPLTGRPPLAVTRTRAVIGAVRLVTGLGENCTVATTRRSPAACRLPTGIALPGGG